MHFASLLKMHRNLNSYKQELQRYATLEGEYLLVTRIQMRYEKNFYVDKSLSTPMSMAKCTDFRSV